jgi:hypothetical protein
MNGGGKKVYDPHPSSHYFGQSIFFVKKRGYDIIDKKNCRQLNSWTNIVE